MKSKLLVVFIFVGTALAFAGDGIVHPKFEKVPDQYIVTLDEKLAPRAAEHASALARSHGGSAGLVWSAGTPGFQFRGTRQAAMALAYNPNVTRVEEDAYVHPSTDVSGTQPTTELPGVGSGPNYLWNLDRIDQHSLPLDENHFWCPVESGTAVRIYVVDTGVLRTHPEFLNDYGEFRVVAGTSTTGEPFSDPADPVAGDVGTNPCNIMGANPTGSVFRHGTWVASVAAGRTVGVAKNATIVP